MSNDDFRLRRHWLHRLSSEVKASIDGRVIHQHRVWILVQNLVADRDWA